MEPKRLYRSEKNKVIAGVCGGIAEYFETDPTWVRLLVTFLTLVTGGIGLIMYIVAWIIVPVNPNQLKAHDTKVR
jgi:phage shock protein C